MRRGDLLRGRRFGSDFYVLRVRKRCVFRVERSTGNALAISNCLLGWRAHRDELRRSSNLTSDGASQLGSSLESGRQPTANASEGTPRKPRSKGKLQNRAGRAYRHADPASALQARRRPTSKLNKSQLNSRERTIGQKSTSDVRALTVPFASARARSGATGASSRHNL